MDLHILTETLATWPWYLTLLLALAVTGVLSWLIALICDRFEPAAGYVGRDWPKGIKGATVNAIGSSMPELCILISFMFIVNRPDEISSMLGAGISVTAGSAIFNSMFIPMMVIFAVINPGVIKLATLGIIRLKGEKTVTEFEIDKHSLKRDLGFLLAAEILLIIFLSTGVFTLLTSGALIGVYLVYMAYMYRDVKNHDAGEGDDDDDEDWSGWSNKKAIWTLVWTTAALVVVCYFLSELIIISADAMGVHPIITALFLGAAASSVPDTILSVKDALKGDYEDAIANAVGSNTFDICIALGAPMFVYILINGPIELPSHGAVGALRIGLLVFTIIVVALLLVPKKVRLWTGWTLAAMYAAWTAFALNTEFHFLPW